MTFQSLVITDDTGHDEITAQIDLLLPIIGHGSPIGVIAVQKAGIFYFDLDAGQFYYCASSDGTLSGTSWAAANFSIGAASTSARGTIQLAVDGDVTTGTDNTKAVTSLLIAAHYALKGANGDITSLTGLTTPLSAAQGGTGVGSIASLFNLLFPSLSGQSGKYLGTADGTTLSFGNPTAFAINLVSSSGSVAVNSFNLVTANSCVLDLPVSAGLGSQVSFGFLPGVSGCVVQSSADVIMDGDMSMTIDVSAGFTLIYTGATYGWWIKS